MRRYTITVKADPPVAHVVPGLRDVERLDEVRFRNKTNGPIEIRMAASGVLPNLTYSRKLKLDPDETSDYFQVKADIGVYEYSVHYDYVDRRSKRRQGFAYGNSSPKIIVIR